MTWIYWLLDAASTGIECFTVYIIADVICVSPKKSRCRWLPAVVSFSMTYLFTWGIDIGAWKMPVLAGVLGIALWIGYGCSIYNALISSFLEFATVGAGEDIATVLFLAMRWDIFDEVGGQSFPSASLYVVSTVIRLTLVLCIRRRLRNFQYPFTFKDFCVVLAVFAPMLLIFNFETVHFIDGGVLGLETMALVIALCTVLIVLILYLKNYLFLRDKAERDRRMIEQLQRQFAYYQEKQRDEERVRSIYHDMKNHLLLLQAQAGNGQEVQHSIQTLQEQIQEYENYHHTGNEFLDVIIRDKAKLAREKQIDFVAAVSFEGGAFLEPLDISTIFGNALDNAIEASEKLPADQRLITVKANRVRNMLVILVENNALPELPVPLGTTKQDAFTHGFGLPNIRTAVERYGGQCSVKAEDGMFLLRILIPIP